MDKSFKNVLERQFDVSKGGKEPEESNCESWKKKEGCYSQRLRNVCFCFSEVLLILQKGVSTSCCQFLITSPMPRAVRLSQAHGMLLLELELR